MIVSKYAVNIQKNTLPPRVLSVKELTMLPTTRDSKNKPTMAMSVVNLVISGTVIRHAPEC